MTAELIGIGTDEDAGLALAQSTKLISDLLLGLGITLKQSCTVGGSEEALHTALAQALERSELIILLGGVGIGDGDITKETLEHGLNIELLTHEESLAQAKEYYKCSKKRAPAGWQKQAMVPEGSTVFLNENGASPAFALASGAQCILSLPGAAKEFMPLLINQIYNYLVGFAEDEIVYTDIGVEGLSIAAVTKYLDELMQSQNPSVAIYPMGRGLLLRVTARAQSQTMAQVICTPAVSEIRDKLSTAVLPANGTQLTAFKQDTSRKHSFIQNVVPWRGDSRGDIIRKTILCISLLVLVCSGTYIANYFYSSQANKGMVSSMENMLVTADDSSRPEGYPAEYLAKFIPWWNINKDVAGRIEIADTPLKYAIVQADDNSYYLRRTFYKKDDKHGVPFLDFRVDLKKESTNTLIYGHNMTDGQIFGELINYKDLSYYKAHPVIQFDSVYREGKYKIAAVVLTTANDPNFDYHNFINPKSSAETKDFIEKINRRTLINTGVDVKTTDKFITLSTCDYSFRDPVTGERIARLVVIGRKVRAGESPEVNTSAAKLNPNPLMPGQYYAKPSQSSTSSKSTSSESTSSKSTGSESTSSESTSSESTSSESTSSESTSSESTSSKSTSSESTSSKSTSSESTSSESTSSKSTSSESTSSESTSSKSTS
ncbi:MAG: molybdopterin-binding protein, partial [Hydrogenoanaerobacterium sp.]